MMKKVTAVALVALFGLSLSMTSCQKKQDWTCKCDNIAGQTTESLITDQKKKDAQTACESLQKVARANGFADAKCSLK